MLEEKNDGGIANGNSNLKTGGEKGVGVRTQQSTSARQGLVMCQRKRGESLGKANKGEYFSRHLGK